MTRYSFGYRVFLLLFVGFLLSGNVHNLQISQSGQPILDLPPHTILDFQFSPDGTKLAQVDAGGRFHVTDTETDDTLIENLIDLPYSLWSAKIAWMSTGDRVAVGIGSQIYIWDVVDEHLINTLHAGVEDPLVYFEGNYYIPEGFVSLQWDNTGNRLMAKTMSSRITIWSSETQSFIVDFFFGNNPVPGLWFPEEQRLLYGAGYVDLETQQFVSYQASELSRGICSSHSSITTNGEQTLIVQGTINGCVNIFDRRTGDEIAAYKIADSNHSIRDLSWSPDESAIVTVDNKGSVQVIEVATGKVTTIAQIDGALYAVDWSPVDTEIAYGGVTTGDDSVFATISVAEVKRLMASDAARQPEFAVTPPPRN